MTDQLESFLQKNNHLSQHFSLRKNKSTILLLKSLHFILDSFEEHLLPLVKFCDLTEAFDVMLHGTCLEKLESFEVKGVALHLFQSYLDNRKHIVIYNKEASSMLDVSQGYSQGLICGPLSFVILMTSHPAINGLYIHTIQHLQCARKIRTP
ncbi:hypothetical protein WA026_001641 [Henosepilachna vigintioctopunctata]|uniref:Reverse transcriptase domain-containing protein n=1 Tax=Henosepilachna vigintioctopunctata TaxID=420089 RepID=A0AAW1USJ0_9CUCU